MRALSNSISTGPLGGVKVEGSASLPDLLQPAHGKTRASAADIRRSFLFMVVEGQWNTEPSRGSTTMLHPFCAALRRAESWTYPAEERTDWKRGWSCHCFRFRLIPLSLFHCQKSSGTGRKFDKGMGTKESNGNQAGIPSA